jgi:DNA-3-methyladenine glycosylase I
MVRKRCAWVRDDPLMRSYHDEDWGVPQHDSRMLWEILMLEGFQAGLSWSIILRKRDSSLWSPSLESLKTIFYGVFAISAVSAVFSSSFVQRDLEDMKRRGFTFVGPTIVYAWMQAVSIVNDHSTGCFRRAQV